MDSFTLPIEYLEENKIYSLPNHIISDLELCDTIDASGGTVAIYNYLYKPTTATTSNELRNEFHKKFVKYYTTDIHFLSEYSKILTIFDTINLDFYFNNDETVISEIYNKWNEIKSDTYFNENYYYIEWSYLEYMNHSETFLQIMNTLNIASPIISLLSPFMILITPFFMLKMFGIKVTLSGYMNILKKIIAENTIGKIFKLLSNETSLKEKAYIIASASWYIYSIYQNTMMCINFNKKMTKIYQFFSHLHLFIDTTIQKINHYVSSCSTLHLSSNAILQFHQNMHSNLKKILEWKLRIDPIQGVWSVYKIKQIGYVMKEFYQYHHKEEFHDLFHYSIGFYHYFNFIENISQLHKDNVFHSCNFIANTETIVDLSGNIMDSKTKESKTKGKSKNKLFIKNNYYAPLVYKSPVKNTIKMDANFIISGPNASGKTTLMKSILLNIILSQQIGMGFYDAETVIKPFEYLHCYLNIPDTSGRDSLFQAEARRCKQILDVIESEKGKNSNHFIIFDELFSGTNPEEATKSSSAFIKYISGFSNVSFLLTTHYNKVCKKFIKSKKIKNIQMDVIEEEEEDNQLKYTYKIKKGISQIKGGFNVLREMNYPEKILADK